MKTITETSPAAYTFAALRGWKVRFADGKTRRAILVRVTSPAGKCYTVRFIEGAGASCTCEWFQRTGNCCKHVKSSATFLRTGQAPLEMPTSDGTHPGRARVTEKTVVAPPAPFDPEAERGLQAALYERERGAWEDRTAGEPQAA